MVRTLDSRSSQNMSYPVLPDQFYGVEPILIAQVGLQIYNPGELIRVHFSGILGVSANPISSSEVSIRTFVVRGFDVETGAIVFIMDNVVDLFNVQTQTLSFTGSDYDIPPPDDDMLVYTCFVSSDLDGAIYRRGPESFNATAYCND